MKVKVHKEAEVPAPPKPVSRVAAEIMGVLDSLKDGEVAEVTPDEGQSIRGLKVSFGRVASNRGIKITTWSNPDDSGIYVKKQ